MSRIKKVALVLSGGGFKGIFQLGVINYLDHHWEQFFPDVPHMEFDVIAGVSAGSLNGVMLASGKLSQLNYIWRKIGRNGSGEIYENNFLTDNKEADDKLTIDMQAIKKQFFPDFSADISYTEGLKLLTSKGERQRFLYKLGMRIFNEFKGHFNDLRGLASNAPLLRKLEKHIDKDKIDSDFLCGFVSLDTGEYISAHPNDFDSNTDFIKGILASTSIPLVFPPIDRISIKGKEYRNLVDGGIVNVSPITDVINFIHDKGGNPEEYALVIINLGSTHVQEISYDEADIIRIALRSVNEIGSANNFNNDLQVLLRINDLVKQILPSKVPKIYKYNLAEKKRTSQVISFFKNIIIQPDIGTLGGTLQLNAHLNDQRYMHGRSKASEALDKLLMAEDPEFLSIIV